MMKNIMRVRKSQKFSRDFLQSILDGIQDPIRIVDRNYQIVFTNVAAVKDAGRPFDAMLGKQCFNLFYNLHEPCSHCLTSWTFSSGKAGSAPFVQELYTRVTVTNLFYSFTDAGRR